MWRNEYGPELYGSFLLQERGNQYEHCHEDQRKIWGDAFDLGTDRIPAFENAHPGVHSHIHIAEDYYESLKMIGLDNECRQIFWRDFMRKAEDARIASAQLRSASEHNQEQAIYFALLDSTYITAAHTVARSHTLYPGAVKDPETQGDKELYGHRDWQIDWDDPVNHAHCGNTYCECTLHHH